MVQRNMVHKPVVIFDFDGTLTCGEEPVHRYAQEAAKAVPPASRERYELAMHAQLDDDPHGVRSRALDGFDLVRSIAQRFEVDDEQLEQAYLRSREHLAQPGVVAATPRGLREFCQALDARLIIATNSPNIGIREQLERWSMTDLFDGMYTGIGKPAGLGRVISELLNTYESEDVAAVGDIAVNDIEPARTRGCTTALVTHGRMASQRAATFVGRELTDLYDPLIAWAGADRRKPLHQHARVLGGTDGLC